MPQGPGGVDMPPRPAPIDAGQIGATITRALRPGPPPPYDELVALERALLLVITDLWAAVAEAERLRFETPGAALRRTRLTSIRRQTAVGLGEGLLSAQMQVRALARDCRWLLDRQTAGAS